MGCNRHFTLTVFSYIRRSEQPQAFVVLDSVRAYNKTSKKYIFLLNGKNMLCDSLTVYINSSFTFKVLHCTLLAWI